jgi:hypothetical protein
LAPEPYAYGAVLEPYIEMAPAMSLMFNNEKFYGIVG